MMTLNDLEWSYRTTIHIQNVHRWLWCTLLVAWWNSEWICLWDPAASHSGSTEELLLALWTILRVWLVRFGKDIKHSRRGSLEESGEFGGHLFILTGKLETVVYNGSDLFSCFFIPLRLNGMSLFTPHCLCILSSCDMSAHFFTNIWIWMDCGGAVLLKDEAAGKCVTVCDMTWKQTLHTVFGIHLRFFVDGEQPPPCRLPRPWRQARTWHSRSAGDFGWRPLYFRETTRDRFDCWLAGLHKIKILPVSGKITRFVALIGRRRRSFQLRSTRFCLTWLCAVTRRNAVRLSSNVASTALSSVRTHGTYATNYFPCAHMNDISYIITGRCYA